MSAKTRKVLKMVLILLLTTLIMDFTIFSLLGRILNRTENSKRKEASVGARSLHEQLLVADMHADSLLWNRDLLRHGNWGHVDLPRLIEGNVALQAFTVITENTLPVVIVDRWPMWTWNNKLGRAIHQAERFQQIAAASGGKLSFIKTRGDLNKYLERRKSEQRITAGFLGVEGAQSLNGDLVNLETLYDAGFRMLGIAHFSDNEFGGSSSGASGSGLTQRGRTLIKKMEERGMLVDLAHASPQVIEDVLEIAERPLIVSHTGVQGTCNNSRNLSDYELKRIGQNGGVICIGYWKVATCGNDLDAIVRSIRYAVDLAGIDHVGLGSDFDGGITTPIDVSELVQITDALLEDKFSEGEIRKIMGENVIRLLLSNLPE